MIFTLSPIIQENLYNFIKKSEFDKLGVFEFSKEKNTYAYSLPSQIPARKKKQRKNKLMKLQQKISKKINENLIGKTIDCIVESIAQDNLVIARSYKDAPEIDGLVYIETAEMLAPGDIISAKITSANEYDLFAKI
jgi:ribosomal protein S12 methylthiotransferase